MAALTAEELDALRLIRGVDPADQPQFPEPVLERLMQLGLTRYLLNGKLTLTDKGLGVIDPQALAAALANRQGTR